MRMNVGALSALCVAITAAMAAPVAGADAAQAAQAQNTAQPAQDQTSTSGQATTKNKPTKKEKPTSSQNQAPVTRLGTIIVTGTLRSEVLQKVAMPISAVTYHDIQREHLQNFMDYAATVPGLSAVTLGPGLTELSMRGISSGPLQPNASVGIYVDNTPYGSSAVLAGGGFETSAIEVPNIDPADLERIEVLHGPQGTLYGAGALGGVIRFITIPPDTENYSGRMQVGGTSVDGGGNGFGLHGMVNLPLVTDKLAIRANVYDTTDPGFISDAALNKTDVNESKVKGGRASVLWTPTATTSLRVTALAQNLNSNGNPTEALDPTTLQPVYGDLQTRSAGGTGTYDGQFRLYNATFNTDFGWASLMSSTSYSVLNSTLIVDETPALFPGYQPNGQPYSLIGPNLMHATRATEEIRLTSPNSQRVQWLGGVFLDHEIATPSQNFYTADYYTGKSVPSPLGNIGFDLNANSYIAYAAYGNVTWHITNRFDLEGGLRYSHDRQRYVEVGDGLILGVNAPTVIVDQPSSDSTTTFSLTPAFHINDRTMLYARVASGFLPGGPNNLTILLPGIPKVFGPTKLTDYELGLKSTSWNDHLITDLSAYYINWTDIQLTTYVYPDSFLSNGGQAESKGLEATIQVIPARGLKLSVNAAYNDATLTKNAPPPSNGIKGSPLPYAPHFTFGLNGDYDFALGGDWHGYVGASYQHMDERATAFASTGLPRATVPGYNTLNLRVGASYDEWNINAYVKNLTNKRGIVVGNATGTLDNVTGELVDNAVIITPRLFGISVSRNF